MQMIPKKLKGSFRESFSLIKYEKAKVSIHWTKIISRGTDCIFAPEFQKNHAQIMAKYQEASNGYFQPSTRLFDGYKLANISGPHRRNMLLKIR
jgi:hypothetical protein